MAEGLNYVNKLLPTSDMTSSTKCSFQKKSKAKALQIPGTKPSLHNNQLLVSTGIPSLDNLIGKLGDNGDLGPQMHMACLFTCVGDSDHRLISRKVGEESHCKKNQCNTLQYTWHVQQMTLLPSPSLRDIDP